MGRSGVSEVHENFHLKVGSLLEHARADLFVVKDAHLLFSGDFQRSGNDLIISDHVDHVTVPNYFHGDKRPLIVSPEGAPLDSRFIDAVIGHDAYAQAGALTPALKTVGHVVKMTGSASVVRNGVSIVVNIGDTLYQNDVVQTGSSSTLGLVLDDGTAFNLTANARFMLNEMVYEPNGASNHSLLTLIQGAASFVAGQVAPTGDMEVATPVAVIGIRGTAVLLDISATDGTVDISVADQHDGQVHSVQIFKCAPTGVQGVCTAGDPIGAVSSNGPALALTPSGNLQVTTQEISKSPAQVSQEFASFQQVLSTYDAGKQQFPNLPQHTENTNPNNSNTGSTRTAMGSTPASPIETPVTSVFADVTNARGGSSDDTLSQVATTVSTSDSIESVSTASQTQSSAAVTVLAVLAPVTPVEITSLGGSIDQVSQTITGTVDVAFVGTVVTILDTYDGVTIALGTTTVRSGGVWTESVTLLGNGTHTIVAQDTSANSTSTPVVFVLDAVPPTVTISTTGTTTNQATQTISGKVTSTEAAPGTTVTLYDNGTQIGKATVGADGSWNSTITLSGSGTHSIVATDTDAAGNTGSSAPVVFTLDVLPTVSINPVDGNNVINYAEAHAAGGVGLTGSVTGTGTTVSVTVVDGGFTKTYAATISGGTWTATIPSSDAVTLANGLATVSAQVTDSSGNTASATSQTVTVAETLPTVSINPVDGDNIINSAQAKASGGISLSGFVTGLAQGATFNVSVADGSFAKNYLATVGTGGTWSATIPSSDAATLANGTATVSAQVTDVNGNQSALASQTVAMDTIAPTVTISTAGTTTDQATQSISGTVTAATGQAAVGGTVTLFDTQNGVTTQVGTATVSNGNWTGSVMLAGNGANSIVAEDTDAAGNLGTSAAAIFTLTIIPGGWGDPSGGLWSDSSNWSSGSAPTSTSNVVFDPIGTTPYSVTIAAGTSVSVNSIALDDPNITLIDEGSLTIATSLIETAGFFEVSGGTLSLGSGSSFVVNFAGSGGSLTLGSSSGFTGTVNATSNATSGSVSINGGGAVTTTIGDAIDLDSTGGTASTHVSLAIAVTGAITGAGSAISVLQNGYGAISITTGGPIIGQSGYGILAEDLTAADNSELTVTPGGSVTGATNAIYVLTDGGGNVVVNPGSNITITGQAPAIEALSNGVGSVSVTTSTGDAISSDGDGIDAYNQDTAIPSTDSSSVVVIANGTIVSGPNLNRNGSEPAGILAGYKGGANTTVNANVFGIVTINSFANITANGGDGIRGYDYGIGNIAITDEANTTITALGEYGIRTANYGSGNVTVTTSTGDTINSGSSAISAINFATAIPSSASTSIDVIANGTINSGTNLNPSGAQSQGISAGYYGANGTQNNAINGAVSVDSFANINAAAGWGIDAFNYGNGAVSVKDEAGTTISGAQYGIGAYSLGAGSGVVTINVLGGATIVAGALYGLWGIQASTNNGSNVSVTTSPGDVIDSGGTGINANSTATSAASSSLISITAYGTINSGFDMGSSGGQPGGIWAGYNGVTNAVNTAIAGAVDLDSFATINAAAGAGVGAYNWGVGSITATLELSSAITAQLWGVNAYALGGGNVSITNDGTISSAGGIGLTAGTGTNLANAGGGTISITNSGTKGSGGNFISGIIDAFGSSGGAVVQINNDSTQGASFTNTGSVVAGLYSAGSSQSLAVSAYYGGLTGNTGTITVSNSGVVSGNVNLDPAPTSTSLFNNQAGGIWNVRGQNFFNGTGTIINSGAINLAGASYLWGILSLTNSSVIDVAAIGEAYIGGAVMGTGTFDIANQASLEFASTVGSGQTVSFGGNEGLLFLDDAAGFAGAIAGLATGDVIVLSGPAITGASLSGSNLAVTQSGVATPLNYAVSGAPSQDTFVVLSGNAIALLPTTGQILTGALTAQSFAAPAGSYFYQLTGAAISSSSATGLNIADTDSNTADTIFVEENQASSIAVTGAFNGMNVTTAGANISIVDFGSINASGGIGLFANSASGTTTIVDYGNISSGGIAVEAASSGTGLLTVDIGGVPTSASGLPTTTITSTNSAAIFAQYSLGSADITTGPGVTINAAATGILVWNEGASVPLADNSSLTVEAAGTINSGLVNNGYFAGIAAGYLGGSSAPSTIPNPPLSGIFGNVTIDSAATINANSGVGINAFEYGTGNISVSDSGSITATQAGNTNGTSNNPTTAQYGITAGNYGIGNVTVVTGSGSTITSGSVGILASNGAAGSQTSPLGSQTAPITVTVAAVGAINSGAYLMNGGNAPAGVVANIDPNNTSGYNGFVYGDVVVNDFGSIDAQAGDGIRASNHGQGNVTVNLGSSATITALNTPAGASGNLSPYGVGAYAYGTGNVTVTMNGGTIQSGSSGIDATNEATAIAAAGNALVTVNAAGTIKAGDVQTNTSSAPAGISAGFLGGSSVAPNLNVNGSVIVNNEAAITVTDGRGINAYNYGNGDVTINDGANVTVNGDAILASSTATTPTQIAEYGIEASTGGGGSGNIAINLYSGAIISATSTAPTITNPIYGVYATSTDAGNISVITNSGTSITSSGVGINAVNVETTIAASVASSIVVTSYSTISSGAVLTGTGSPPGGIVAGYLGGSTIPTTFPLTGLFGDVTVNNFGSITAAAGDGIRAYNYGEGDVTVNDGAGTITALGGSSPTNGYGNGISASVDGPGNVMVSTAASVVINSGSSGIAAVNKAPAPVTSNVSVPSTSTVSVLAYGTITSGTIPTGAGDPPAGIYAGYNPNNSDAVDPNVAGNVWIDDYATITAAAGTDGIRGINYGVGSVNITTEVGANISAGRYGIGAFAYDGGNVSVTNYGSVTGTTAAIDASATGNGTVSIYNYGTITGNVISGNTTTFDNESGGVWTLNGSAAFTGTTSLINSGTIDLSGGSMTVGSASGSGMVDLTGSSSSLVVTGNVTGISGGTSSYVINGGKFTVEGMFNAVNTDIAASGGGQVQLAGLSGVAVLAVSDATSSIEIGTLGNPTAGSITIDSGVTTAVSGTFSAPEILDNGTIVIGTANDLTLAGALGGTGQIDIGSLALLGVTSVVANATTAIDFTGTSGELLLTSGALNGSLQFTPVLNGLTPNDMIDFQGTVTNAFWNNGVLTLMDGAAAVAYLNLPGNYSADTFTVTVSGGVSQIVDPPATPQSIANGAVLELTAPTADKVIFSGSTGSLTIDQPSGFDGQIAGISGPGDVLHLKTFDTAHTSASAAFNPLNDTTELTVSDSSNHHSVALTLDGNYSSFTFQVAADPNGGVDITTLPTPVTAIASGGSLELIGASGQTIVFDGGTGSLVLDQPRSFNGDISGFTGTQPDAAHSDTIDLVGIDYTRPAFSETFNASTGLLSVSDGVHSASLAFNDFDGVFHFASDNRGGTIITDPPAAAPVGNENAEGGVNGDQLIFRDHFAGPTGEKDFSSADMTLNRPAADSMETNDPSTWHSGHESLKDDLFASSELEHHFSDHGSSHFRSIASTLPHANEFIIPLH